MPIAQSKYVDITSGRAGVPSSTVRELGARFFSTNELIPTGMFVTSQDLEGVAEYFGTSSTEYSIAQQYFGFTGKRLEKVNRIDFASHVNADVAPKIFGARLTQTATEIAAITDGSIVINIGGVIADLTAIDLSSASDFASIAALLQTAVRTGTGTVFTSATVTYDALRGAFLFVGGETGANTIDISAGSSGTDISGVIGWRGIGVVLSNGAVAQTPVEAVTLSDESNDNFGSFSFIDSLSLDQHEAVSDWNHQQNVKYFYFATLLAIDAFDYNSRLIANSGTGLVLSSTEDRQEVLPMAVFGSIDYTRAGASRNFMFQTGDFVATVDTTSASNSFDALRVNYVGETRAGNSALRFFQRGYLMGDTNAPTDMGVYANEVWFKAAMTTAYLNLLLDGNGLSANQSGITTANGVAQVIIAQAVLNGTFSIGRTLTTAERADIFAISGDENTYQQIESIGYWISFRINQNIVNGLNENELEYTLIYARDNTIRKVVGTNVIV